MSSCTNNIQNVKCGWTGCAHRFGSEIDMNMHVLMNHMVLLDHGEFVMTRRVQSRKRAARETEIVVEEPIAKIPAENHEIPRISPFRPAPIQKPAVPKPQKPVIPVAKPVPAQPVQMVRPAIKPEIFDVSPLRNIPGGLKMDMEVFDGELADEIEDSEAAGTSGALNINIAEAVAPEIQIPDQAQLDLEQLLQLQLPRKMSDVVDEFLERLRPMKQLGFIRPNKTVYCIVCLKYVKSFHECNWKHSPAEDRVAEMWYRRFGPDKPTGKTQLMRELEEIKIWLQTEEDDGIVQENV